MKIAIVKYNAGNIMSVSFALDRIGAPHVITADFEELRSADRVIFPGVGEASTTMAHLREKGLDKLLLSLGQPVLGICLGMQLMCSHSEEWDTPCLGIFDAQVRKFPSSWQGQGLKVPHMGWSVLHNTRGPLLEGLEGQHVYFVHSYFVELGEHTAARATHGLDFSAAISKGNFHATQFHPEKSGDAGERILRNFLDIKA